MSHQISGFRVRFCYISAGQNACWVKKVPKVYMAVASIEGTGVSLWSLFYELFKMVTECLLKYCI